MSNYRRHRVAGGCYFFTVNLLDRKSRLLVEHIDLLREAVRAVKAKRPFHIDAWVVLPDHLHAMWTLPPGDDDFAGRWRAIKTAFSKELPKREQRSALREARGERGIWQHRYWEHTIRDERDYAMHFDYIHINPIKHAWVQSVTDWPYSSFHRAVAQEIYAADWAGDMPDFPTGE